MELCARQLGFRVPGRCLWQNLDLQVPSGGSLALCGASGAGKSTLLACLAGLCVPSAGQVLWNNVPLPQRAARRLDPRLGWLSQAPLLDFQASTWQNLTLPRAFRALPGYQARATALLEQLGLAALRQVPARLLSGGQQVRLALARSLLGKPSLLLADEPTGTLDADTALRVGEELLRHGQELGCTVIIATHDPLLAQRCTQQLQLGALPC